MMHPKDTRSFSVGSAILFSSRVRLPRIGLAGRLDTGPLGASVWPAYSASLGTFFRSSPRFPFFNFPETPPPFRRILSLLWSLFLNHFKAPPQGFFFTSTSRRGFPTCRLFYHSCSRLARGRYEPILDIFRALRTPTRTRSPAPPVPSFSGPS